MGYTADNPPYYVRPLLEEYSDLDVKTCGYQKGSWVRLAYTGGEGRTQTIEFHREITNSITVKRGGSGELNPSVPSTAYDSTAERDRLIGEHLATQLGGYETFHEALDDCDGIRYYT